MLDPTETVQRPTLDGMPQGQNLSLTIRKDQVKLETDVAVEASFDNDAAASIVWNDFQKSMAWVDTNSWLLEWQYIDYLYQSANYDRDWRTTSNRAARISRFNVAKNRNTMSSQTRRAVFGDDKWFVLEPRGKMAAHPDVETYMKAWTELFLILCDRADLEYQMRLFIECQTLQGTAIAIPGWDEKDVIHTWREPKAEPKKVTMPTGEEKTIHTFESDDWETKHETVRESWPFIEYRRLGTTLYNEKWRHPGRPELSGWPRIDVDYLDFQEIRQLRELDCYHMEDPKTGGLKPTIPDDQNLLNYWLEMGLGNAEPGTQLAQQMNANSTVVFHAQAENVQTSINRLDKPIMKIAHWTEKRVIEILCYDGRKLVIRNEEHGLGDHAAGYSATWWNIDNSGYGYGTGRLNAGDQRMSTGVLNEVLKMIAFPMNAPILYDNASGNAPAQNIIAGLGLLLGIDTGKSGDVNKSVGFMKMAQIPPEAWKIYELAMQGGEQVVGADKAMMQGQLPGAGSSIGRTATGASRLAEKADDSIADPVQMIEWVLTKFLEFLWKGVREVMPIKEIRDLLSDKLGEAILETLDSKDFLNAKFDIAVLCGKKLAAKAAIAQLIPFLLQILQQPNIEQYLQQIGLHVNYEAIANLFLRMSELAVREDIFVPMTAEQKATAQQMNPNFVKMQAELAKERERGQGNLQRTKLEGDQDLTRTIVDKAMDHVVGAVPLELAEARLERNNDMQTLSQGAVQPLQ